MIGHIRYSTSRFDQAHEQEVRDNVSHGYICSVSRPKEEYKFARRKRTMASDRKSHFIPCRLCAAMREQQPLALGYHSVEQ